MLHAFMRNAGSILAHAMSWLILLGFAINPQASENARLDQAANPIISIRALLDLQVAAWNRGDLDAFMTTYWNSPDLVFQSGGIRTRGWQATLDRYRRRYQAEGKAMGRLAFSEVEIEILGPSAALARGRWRLEMPDGTHPAGLYTLILKNRPEGWRIVHDHTSMEE
jgi:beta-aspartyl-peptidase (threonine type)